MATSDALQTNEQIHVVVDELPVYMTVEPLAKYLGIGRDVLVEHLERIVDPLPYLPIGNRKYVNRFSAIDYFKELELGGKR